MNAFLHWCIMSRNKEPKPKLFSNRVPIKNKNPVTCSGCYKYLEQEQVTKKAKIRDREFSFCDDKCYNRWLGNPSTMLL